MTKKKVLKVAESLIDELILKLCFIPSVFFIIFLAPILGLVYFIRTVCLLQHFSYSEFT